MTRPLQGAVIGCGFFAQNHLAAWAELGEAEIVAVCDLFPAKAHAAAAKFGVPRVYTDVNELLANERLDFVDIPTTVETHEALVGLSVSHGVPVIVQKPFGPDLAACRRMAVAARSAGVLLMVHEDFRFQNLFQTIRRILDEGEIGPLTFGRLSWRTAIDVYANQPYLVHTKRFMIMDVGVHMLDLARFLFGDAQDVFCRTQKVKKGIAGEDAATIVLSHDSGATSIVDISYASRRDPDPFPQTPGEIEGELGSILIEPGGTLRIHARGRTRTQRIGHDARSWTSEPWTQIQDSVVHTQRHFIQSLLRSEEPQTSARNSLHTYGLVEAAYLSAETGAVVTPERE